MPNLNWEQLSNRQMGQLAKYYFMMEFASYGCAVDYPNEINPRIDFTVRSKYSQFEIKVRSVRGLNYIFFEKDKFELRETLYAAIGIFKPMELPKLYLVNSALWRNPNGLFVSREYKGRQTPPEWGINLSEKNMPLLEEYSFVNIISSMNFMDRDVPNLAIAER